MGRRSSDIGVIASIIEGEERDYVLHSAGNYKNSLSRYLCKNFVKVTHFAINYTEYWFHEIFLSGSKILVFPHCVNVHTSSSIKLLPTDGTRFFSNISPAVACLKRHNTSTFWEVRRQRIHGKMRRTKIRGMRLGGLMSLGLTRVCTCDERTNGELANSRTSRIPWRHWNSTNHCNNSYRQILEKKGINVRWLQILQIKKILPKISPIVFKNEWNNK